MNATCRHCAAVAPHHDVHCRLFVPEDRISASFPEEEGPADTEAAAIWERLDSNDRDTLLQPYPISEDRSGNRRSATAVGRLNRRAGLVLVEANYSSTTRTWDLTEMGERVTTYGRSPK